jgi:hypothetical protein
MNNALSYLVGTFTLLVVVLSTACSSVPGASDPGRSAAQPPATDGASSADPLASVPAGARATAETEEGPAPSAAADDAGVRTNRRVDVPDDTDFRQLLPFDGIPPIYEPSFVGADEAPLQDDELVLAISLEDRAKAYPITVLRSREMVNDDLAGIPILVTW